jgi:hypothetical protein
MEVEEDPQELAQAAPTLPVSLNQTSMSSYCKTSPRIPWQGLSLRDLNYLLRSSHLRVMSTL